MKSDRKLPRMRRRAMHTRICTGFTYDRLLTTHCCDSPRYYYEVGQSSSSRVLSLLIKSDGNAGQADISYIGRVLEFCFRTARSSSSRPTEEVSKLDYCITFPSPRSQDVGRGGTMVRQKISCLHFYTTVLRFYVTISAHIMCSTIFPNLF